MSGRRWARRLAAAGGVVLALTVPAAARDGTPGAGIAASPTAALGAAPADAEAEAVTPHVDDPRAVHDYLLSCGGCHQLDGRGSAHVPPLRGVDRLLAHAGGRAYVLRVPGVTQAPLSDSRLAALLNWVFAEFGSGAPTPRFSAAEVAAGRAEAFVDPRAARAALR